MKSGKLFSLFLSLAFFALASTQVFAQSTELAQPSKTTNIKQGP